MDCKPSMLKPGDRGAHVSRKLHHNPQQERRSTADSAVHEDETQQGHWSELEEKRCWRVAAQQEKLSDAA